MLKKVVNIEKISRILNILRRISDLLFQNKGCKLSQRFRGVFSVRTRELVFALSIISIISGCNSIWNGWLDPTQVGRFKDKSVTMDLRRSISIADEPEINIDASEPTENDLKVVYKDYVLKPGDVIDISIFELLIPGTPWVETRQISQEGFITLPQVRQDILAKGKTARELQKYIARVLQEEQILTDPIVTVLIREARGRIYNILGSISAPGSNVIPRPDFRILDALAASGGISPAGGPKQPTIKEIYIFRNVNDNDTQDTGETINHSDNDSALSVMLSGVNTQPIREPGHWIWVDGEWKFVKDIQTTKPTTEPAISEKPTTVPAEKQAELKHEQKTTTEAQKWEQLASKLPTRKTIVIPLDKLEQGDPRYNVVIRDGDTIWVPRPMEGEFYIMGNVLRPGVYSLTGREITLRQAISAAGGLGPIADPSRCELIRRIGGNQEQIVKVNLDAIFAGKEPDIILKPDDIINVGTNPVMPFLAVIRNAFRLTYGFGFVYDRNFADIDSFEGQQNPADRRRAERLRRFGF